MFCVFKDCGHITARLNIFHSWDIMSTDKYICIWVASSQNMHLVMFWWLWVFDIKQSHFHSIWHVVMWNRSNGKWNPRNYIVVIKAPYIKPFTLYGVDPLIWHIFMFCCSKSLRNCHKSFPIEMSIAICFLGSFLNFQVISISNMHNLMIYIPKLIIK